MVVTINPRAHMIAASIVGTESDVLDTVANRILGQAKAKALRHKDTGNYMRSLKVVVAEDRNGKDRLVVADDPAAVPIEFGHWRRTKRGRRVRAVWVPGLRIMRDTYAEIRGRRG